MKLEAAPKAVGNKGKIMMIFCILQDTKCENLQTVPLKIIYAVTRGYKNIF